MRPLATVQLPVAPQCSRSGEVFVANAAAVRFDPCVAPHVCLHVLEALPTDAAGATGLSVSPQVTQQDVR